MAYLQLPLCPLHGHGHIVVGVGPDGVGGHHSVGRALGAPLAQQHQQHVDQEHAPSTCCHHGPVHCPVAGGILTA